jgi:pyruvate kinase
MLLLSPAPICRLAFNLKCYPSEVRRATSLDEVFVTGARLAKDLGLAKAGDLVVITGGVHIDVAGFTSLLKVEKAG